MVSYDEIRKYKTQKIDELKHSEKYNDILKYIEHELYMQIDQDPLRLAAYIKIPNDINVNLLIERLTEEYEYDYKVRQEERNRTIIILLG